MQHSKWPCGRDPTVVTTERAPAKVGGIGAIILISYFVVLLDNSVVFTGLPSIRDGLDLSPSWSLLSPTSPG